MYKTKTANLSYRKLLFDLVGDIVSRLGYKIDTIKFAQAYKVCNGYLAPLRLMF